MEDIRPLGCLMCQHPSPTLAYIIHIKDAHLMVLIREDL